MKVKFQSYYKYSFSFLAEDGRILIVGGDRDDIYRFEAQSEMEAIEKDGVFEIDGLEAKVYQPNNK